MKAVAVPRFRADIDARYRSSIARFDFEFSYLPIGERNSLLLALLNQCENARRFDWRADKAARKRDRDAVLDAASVARAARKIAAFVSDNAQIVTAAAVLAALKSAVHLRAKEDPLEADGMTFVGPGQSVRLAKYLDAFADELEKDGISADKRPYMHRFTKGPLMFDKPVDDAVRPILPSTCLAVLLVLMFRKFAATGRMGFQRGEEMPAEGDPHWILVTEMVGDALGQSRSGEGVKSTAEKLIRNHQERDDDGKLIDPLRILGFPGPN
jgi:hypothetical protein